MARLFARGLLIALAALTGCTAPAQPRAPVPAAPPPAAPVRAETPPVRVAPTRPAPPVLWPTTRLRTGEYVSVRDIAKRFDLKAAWYKSEMAMTLGDPRSARFMFESNQRDFHFDGLRIFLGEPVLVHKDSLWVSLPDVIKIVAPLFRPADHLALLPPAPPQLIVLDPGHGGTDPGTENKRLGVNEKTFSLDVAARVKKILEGGGFRVLQTRDKDARFANSPAIDLPLRADFANKAGADVFVSIHFNNAPEAVTGVETYALPSQFMLSTADTRPDELTATALPGNRQDYANLMLGYEIHRAMLAGLKTPDRGYKRARWAVLRPLNCPGILVECAYLSNDGEARRVSTPEFRQQIAEAIARGVQNYAAALAGLRPSPAPPPDATKSK